MLGLGLKTPPDFNVESATEIANPQDSNSCYSADSPSSYILESPQNYRFLKNTSCGRTGCEEFSNIFAVLSSSTCYIKNHPFSTDFETYPDSLVGMGSNGPIRLARSRASGRSYAVKLIHEPRKLYPSDSTAGTEGLLLLELDHANIVKLHYVYEQPSGYALVFERCHGEDLMAKIENCKYFDEPQARILVHQMVSSINYLHERNIVHRDLKLENWFISDENDGRQRLKLIDFGFARIWNPLLDSPMSVCCGSLSYVSPEAINGEYTNKCDIWSLGVVVVMILLGFTPFAGPTEFHTKQKIRKGKLAVGGPRWDILSSQAKNFIFSLLHPDPQKRLSSNDALAHPWIRQPIPPPMPLPFHPVKAYLRLQPFLRPFLSLLARQITTTCSHELYETIDMILQGSAALSRDDVVISLKLQDCPDPSETADELFQVLGHDEVDFEEIKAILTFKFDCQLEASVCETLAIHGRTMDGRVVSELEEMLSEFLSL